MSFFSRNEVRAKVLEIVDSRIESAQSEFNKGCEQIQEETGQAITAIVNAGEKNKEGLLKRCVSLVLR